MAIVRKREDWELTIGLQSKISMQFFSLSTIYPDCTSAQLMKSISLLISEIGDVAIVKYVYARKESGELVTFSEYPKPIVKSEDLKHGQNN